MKSVVAGVLCLAAVAAAEEPRVKQTVDAIAGRWTTDLVLTLPGQQPIKFKTTINCVKIAGGTAVQCALRAKVPGMGELAETDLWAWDPEGQAVHDMTVNNWGEVHDHKGVWKDDHTVEFTHTATQGSKPLEERETVTFRPPNQMEFKMSATTPDGTTTFEGKARR